MRILLDTDILLWALTDNPKLSIQARETIVDEGNEIRVSAASIWEISIKQSLGKLDAPEDLLETIEATPFDILPITAKHAIEVRHLPLHHRVPFDRMLIAQARLEGMTIATRDRTFEGYGVPIMVA